MIVVCSTCQARFKVADEKIGPRGAKVRCSKCQTVFVVHKELGVIPAEAAAAPAPPPPAPEAGPRGLELDLEGSPGAGLRPNGFVADPFARGAPAPAPDPFAAAAPPFTPSADPFAAAAPAAPHPAADPFAVAAPPVADTPFGAADPFAVAAPASGAGGAGLGAIDPFVATVAAPAPGLPTSAVTDLSDLLGIVPPPPAPAPPHEAAPPPAAEPPGIMETGFDFDTSSGAAPDLDMAPPGVPPPVDAPGAAEPDLALSERTPAHVLAPAPIPGMGDFAGADPFSLQPEPMEGGGSGLEAGGGGALEIDAPMAVPAPPPALRAPAAPAPGPAAETAAPETTDEVVAAAGFRHRASRARTVLVNAVSLVALLAVALGFLAIWRGVRPGSGLLRAAPAADGEAGQEGAFAVSQLRSALYDRPDAPPILFVTGTAVSHAAASVPGLKVSVEVVRKGAVLARGDAPAGAVLGPEELSATRDAAGIEAAQRKRAAGLHGVKPGEALPFLVAISDFPSDVAGAGLRVHVEPVVDPPPPSAAPLAPGAPEEPLAR